MSGLLSKQSQARETAHIYKSVSDRLLTLRKRMVRWASIAMASGVVSVGLIGGGLALLLLGQMPDSLTLVEPSVSSRQLIESADYTGLSANDAIGTLIGILDGPVTMILASIIMLSGMAQAVLQKNISGFITSLFTAAAIFFAPQVMLFTLGETEARESTPYSQIRPQFEIATESSNWLEAWELLKPIPDTSDDVIVLKAQVAYKAGLEPESVRLIQSIKSDTQLSGQVWFIDSAYAERHESADYQLTEVSQAYAENKASRRSLGVRMLKGAAPFGVLTFLAGCVAFLLRRNTLNIQSWLKQKKDQKHD